MTNRLLLLRGRVGTWSASSALGVDTGIAALCYLATVVSPLGSAAGGGWSLYVLAALAAVPLVWRRRDPIAVAAVVGAGTIGLAVTGAQASIPLPYGQLVATYTMAALASPLWRLIGTAVTAAGVVAVVVLVLGQGPAALATAALPFVVAYAMGTGVRARRDRMAMLEERTRRLAEEQRAQAARERAGIAREIHDIVAHSVSMMVVQAEAGLVLRDDPDRVGATLETISDTGRESLTQLGRALSVLRGDGAARQPQPGLADLPDLLVQARLAGLDATLIEQGRPRPVSADLAAAVYRLVQEALTNTIRHARANLVRVQLDWQGAALLLQITDDGAGPPARPGGSGHGLVGMRERVQAFGGRFDTTTGDGAVGFRVVVTLPLGPPPAGGGDPDG